VKKRTTRTAWWLSAVLAVALVVGVGLLGVRLKTYWVAKYRGDATDFHNALLIYAPLQGSNLTLAILSGANLRNANLVGAQLSCAQLNGANLRGADLRGAFVEGANLSWKMVWRRDGPNGMVGDIAGSDGADLSGADLRGTDLAEVDLTCVRLTGAHCDRRTRWPADFEPLTHGAILAP
jgi:uncharacterized protein YjbI with pentapeptide repeats